MQALAELAVEGEKWEEAEQLAAQHPELSQAVCLPWAEWLLSKGSFQQARQAYRYYPPLLAALPIHPPAPVFVWPSCLSTEIVQLHQHQLGAQQCKRCRTYCGHLVFHAVDHNSCTDPRKTPV